MLADHAPDEDDGGLLCETHLLGVHLNGRLTPVQVARILVVE